MRNIRAFISYALAAISGMCFVGGLAILNGDKH